VAADTSLTLRGVDFSSSPTRRKPIVLAQGRLLKPGQPGHPGQASDSGMSGGAGRSAISRTAACAIDLPAVELQQLRRLESLDAYADTLNEPGPWVGAFDFPFSLPRELVETLGWPTAWLALMQHYRSLARSEIREHFAAFCNARPAGGKFAHRACDLPAGSSPSMKWVNPPVAFMLQAGVGPLIDAGCDIPGLHAGDPTRVALEAYPGLLAREILGRRSYKADDKARQDDARRVARTELIDALQAGHTRLALRLKLTREQRTALIDEPQGDLLDAVLCLMQAGWASQRTGWGLPADMDPLEGWIVSA
jgi:hypothetical protein